MNEYVNMWKNYTNFNDRTNIRGYWMAVLINFGIAVALSILSGIFSGLFDSSIFGIISSLYGLAVLVPGLAMCIRRLRDSGKAWTSIFFGLIPLAGPIILIVFLCRPSAPLDGTPIV